MRLALPALVALALLAAGLAQRTAAADITPAEVRAAIARGADYLKSKQNKVQGNWAEVPNFPGGMTALCTLALLNAGVPPEDESIQKALKYLRGLGKPTMVYSTSLATMAMVAADPSPNNKDKALIRRNAEYLASIQIKTVEKNKGAWAYSNRNGHGNGDPSNTQFALLALHEAQRVGVEIREDVWALSREYWLRRQQESGGWNYFEGQPSTGSMTCAGIASLVICADAINSGDAVVVGETVRCCQADDAEDPVASALASANEWMGRNFTAKRNPANPQWLLYYLYGVERVGRLTGQRFFGSGKDKHDWYREGAELLLRERSNKFSGSWTGVGERENDPLLGTSLALLFLSKGRRPVVIANVKRDPEDDWNLHRNAVGNLTRHVERRWGRDLTWQTIDSRAATAEELLQSPVLFFSGRDSLKLSRRQQDALRSYVDSGGFIFAEAACDGGNFDRDFRALMKEIFPDSKLDLLPADHPIWYAEMKVDPEETPLWGLNSCCRTSVVYCPKSLSCYWELGHQRSMDDYPNAVRERIERALAIGANVLAYATGRELRDKLDVPNVVGGERPDESDERPTLVLAKLSHGGGSDDAPSALANLAAVLEQEVGLRARAVPEPIPIDETMFRHPIVFMHGRRSFRLSDVERNYLRQYLERGGFLFADAICANEQFADAFRREINTIFREAKLQELPADHPLLTKEFRGYDVRKVTLRDPKYRAEGDPLKARVSHVAPTLEGLEINGRLAIVFSPYDLSCALENSPSLECKGYDRRDAARIGVNVLLYALQQ